MADQIVANRQITVNVPQGVGDIYWVYQKLSPYVDKINFNIILTTDPNPVQTRSHDWLVLLPKCGRVSFVKEGPDRYDKLIAKCYQASEVLVANNGVDSIDCCFNKNLEEGQRLDAIDPHLPIEWKPSMRCESFALPFSDYVTLYVSGSNKSKDAWDLPTWVGCINAFYAKYNLNCPLVLIGASYDAGLLADLLEEFTTKTKLRTRLFIDLPPAKIVHLFKNAHFFIGYQSGLNVIADICGTPQLMVYFPKLEPMMNTWCRPEHLGNGKFTAVLFSDNVEKVVTALPVFLPKNEG